MNIRRLILSTFLIVFVTLQSHSQVPSWQWAKSFGATLDETSLSICADPFGNVFVAGYFDSGSLTIGSNVLINGGSTDIFVAKINGSGTVVWSKRFGGSQIERGFAIASDPGGSCYLSGTFSSPTLTINSTTLVNSGGQDIFIAKFDPNGSLYWAKQAGSSGFEIVSSICTDALGNVYATGNFQGPTINFGGITLGNSGLADIFIVKYDAIGNVVWAKREGSFGSDQGYSIATDLSGNIFLCGYYWSPTITFGSTTLTNIYYLYEDLFIVKYDGNGNVLWARGAGGTDGDEAKQVATDNYGNVYMTGFFRSPVITFNTTTLIRTGNSDVFVTKYDPSGNELWVKHIGSPVNEAAHGLCVDATGQLYLTGSFNGTINFGNSVLVSGGMDDCFIVCYDWNGNEIWCVNPQGSFNDISIQVCSNNQGNAFITGNFKSSILTFGSTDLFNQGERDVFVAKLDALFTSVANSQPLLIPQLLIKPNPFSYQTTISFGKELVNGTILLINSAGGKAIEYRTSGSELLIGRESLSDGIYDLQVTDENGYIANKKIAISSKN